MASVRVYSSCYRRIGLLNPFNSPLRYNYLLFLLNKATLCTQFLEELFFSFPRSAWECRGDAPRRAWDTRDAERPLCIPTRSVGTSRKITALESKASALATPSYLNQSRPNLKVWTPMRLNLMAVRLKPLLQPVFSRLLVPTLRVGMPRRRSASSVGHPGRRASTLHSHAERGNEKKLTGVHRVALTRRD